MLSGSSSLWRGQSGCVQPNTVRIRLNSVRIYYVSEGAGHLSSQLSG